MMNPMKYTSSRDQRLWSEWIESLTKDVECYFGILEGCLRILRNGMPLQSQRLIKLFSPAVYCIISF